MVTNDQTNKETNKQMGEPRASLLVEHWAKQTFAKCKYRSCFLILLSCTLKKKNTLCVLAPHLQLVCTVEPDFCYPQRTEEWMKVFQEVLVDIKIPWDSSDHRMHSFFNSVSKMAHGPVVIVAMKKVIMFVRFLLYAIRMYAFNVKTRYLMIYVPTAESVIICWQFVLIKVTTERHLCMNIKGEGYLTVQEW